MFKLRFERVIKLGTSLAVQWLKLLASLNGVWADLWLGN